MSDGPLTQQAVEQVLNEFTDPEAGRGIVTLEQVRDLKLDGDKLALTLGLTTFSAPLWKQTRADLVEHIRRHFPQLTEVDVDLVEHHRAPQKLGEVGLSAKAVIAVGSGKGGVGKSTIAASFAVGLSRAGAKVGLMDADVYGPSIPHLLGTEQRPTMIDGKIQPVDVGNMKVLSMGLLVPAEEAVIWRGPMLHGAITQFLRDTNWGDLDYLIIDMPPGTGDIAITLSQLLPLTGSVVVCTPQDVALLDATKAVAMFRKVNIEVLGMVENMSHFTCPNCNSRHEIFGCGGAKARAEQLNVPFLGEVPINMQMRIRGDEGTLASCFDDKTVAPYLEDLCTNLVKKIVSQRRQKPPMPSLSVLG
ncbi:MAG: Mrp/NBP35 family ATP-binding protein [Planctomycetaceae bacterium]|nr:Mrp/NBP35 family ATP-binding protein [Planctomycetaceae bacterium]